MKLIKCVTLIILLIVFTSMTIIGRNFNPRDVYSNPKDVQISKYINWDKNTPFVIKDKEIKDTVIIVFRMYINKEKTKLKFKSINTWDLNVLVCGKSRETYGPYSNSKNKKYYDIFYKQFENIQQWGEHVDINKLISENKIKFDNRDNVYGLHLYYYLVPDK